MKLGNRTIGDARLVLANYDEMLTRRRAQGKDLYLVPDRQLGWRLLPSQTHPRWPYRTNRLGNRVSGSCIDIGSKTQAQLAILGNSHVHGDEVPDMDTWVYQTQEKLGRDVCLHNLGVSAYGTDQAILRFQEFAREHCLSAAVLAITTTEIYRNLNQCRAFIMDDREVPLFKPRFLVQGDDIELCASPSVGERGLADVLHDPQVLRNLRKNDAFFPSVTTQGYDIARRLHLPLPSIWQRLFAEAVDTTARLCRYFVEQCNHFGIRPAFMFLPVYWGGFPAGKEYDLLSERIAGLAPIFDARKVFTPERLAMPRSVLHHRANHYTRATASWIATFMADELHMHMNAAPSQVAT